MYFRRMVADLTQADLPPPMFLRLAGDPLRWRLLSELARSDRRVGELVALVGQPQNAVSYHLGRLRAGGLVSMRRSSADGRDSYYRIDLPRCGQLLAAAGAALHPGLTATPASPAVRRRASPPRVRVLFLCTGNSARSQIAEALLAHAAGERVEVASAGSHPKALHPNAVRVMRGYGIDLSGRRSKHLDEFTGHRFDYVITLCDKVREVCPEFPGRPAAIHWSIPDPAADGTGRASYPAFRAVTADLHTRIGYLTQAIATQPTAPAPATAKKGDPL
jgi:protein-tyrosine-phosphatase/DNA-binding transcriptional ArsR family regulator